MITHKLKGLASTREVWIDNEWLDPRPSQKFRNHSPDGFNWGYGGSGPSQLALAVALKLGKQDNYMNFKWNVISLLPINEDFDIIFTDRDFEKVS